MQLGLGEEKVNVLGHEDVAEEKKAVTSAQGFEGPFEDDAGMVVV
jgi:hypothetical protein